MKLYATVKNNRGGKKSTGDDTRILVELSYGNKMLGTIGLYAIINDKAEGYRVVWQEEGRGFSADNKPILEVVKAKNQKGEEVCPKTGESHAGWEMSNHDIKCLDCDKIL